MVSDPSPVHVSRWRRHGGSRRPRGLAPQDRDLEGRRHDRSWLLTTRDPRLEALRFRCLAPGPLSSGPREGCQWPLHPNFLGQEPLRPSGSTQGMSPGPKPSSCLRWASSHRAHLAAPAQGPRLHPLHPGAVPVRPPPPGTGQGAGGQMPGLWGSVTIQPQQCRAWPPGSRAVWSRLLWRGV